MGTFYKKIQLFIIRSPLVFKTINFVSVFSVFNAINDTWPLFEGKVCGKPNIHSCCWSWFQRKYFQLSNFKTVDCFMQKDEHIFILYFHFYLSSPWLWSWLVDSFKGVSGGAPRWQSNELFWKVRWEHNPYDANLSVLGS